MCTSRRRVKFNGKSWQSPSLLKDQIILIAFQISDITSHNIKFSLGSRRAHCSIRCLALVCVTLLTSFSRAALSEKREKRHPTDFISSMFLALPLYYGCFWPFPAAAFEYLSLSVYTSDCFRWKLRDVTCVGVLCAVTHCGYRAIYI